MSTGLFLEKNDKNFLIVIAVVIFTLVTDTMINQVSDFLAPQLVSNFGIALFVLFAIIFGITQYIVLRYTKKKIAYMYSRSRSTRILYKIVSSIQYFLLMIVFYSRCSNPYFIKLLYIHAGCFNNSELFT